MHIQSVIAGLLAVPVCAAVASAGEVRSGAAAFGDWRGDAPGVIRHIAAADLPPPYATPSSADGPSVMARPPGAVPRVPEGFAVSLFAAGLQMPRVIRTAPDGSEFVAESSAGRITRFAADGSRSAFADGLDRPFGIAFWPRGPKPRFVYIANTNSVVRFAYADGDLKAGTRSQRSSQ